MNIESNLTEHLQRSWQFTFMEDKRQEEAPSSSSSETRPKMGRGGISLINDDLLHNILSRLPALTFASAACVSKSWNLLCTRILLRPRIASALSVKPSARDAVNEVLDKVLCNPIRPHFAIANVGSGLGARDTLILIEQKLGPKVPIVVSCVGGIIGRDALTDKFREIKWEDMDSDPEEEYEQVPSDVNIGIVLTVGFLPGLKVDVIPLLRPTKAPQVALLDKFVMDIRDYTSSVSGCRSPVGVVMFGDAHIDQKPIMEKLDYAMPMETVILGDEKACFVYRSADDSRNVCGSIKYFSDAVALVFARDRNKPPGVGEIQFHAALSAGVSPIGPRYKAASVRGNTADRCTWITARREGQQEILDGQTILNNINDEMENRIGSPDLYVGVAKQRKCAVGSEKAKRSKYLSFHGVSGGDDEYLYVDGLGIKTGDYFQFYHSDPNAASSSCSRVTESLQNLKQSWNSRNCSHTNGDREAFGGLIFTCSGRGESFFGRLNTDSSPILENFPEIPLAGIFCGGEICRGSPNLIAQENQVENDSHCFLHVYSTVYLLLFHTPGISDH